MKNLHTKIYHPMTNKAILTVKETSANNKLNVPKSQLFATFGIISLFIIALGSLKIGAIVMAILLAGSFFNTLYQLRKLNFELDFKEDLMTEIIADLQKRNN